MSILKDAIGWIGSFIFAFSLMGMISAHATSQFTDYDKIKHAFIDIMQVQLERHIEQVTEEQILEEIQLPPGAEYLEIDRPEAIYQLLLETCEGKNNVEIPMDVAGGFGYGDPLPLVIDCNDFKANATSGETAIRYLTGIVAESIFDDFYYKEYDCSFLECVQKGDMFVMLSAKGNEFMNNITILMFVGTGVGAAMIIISYDEWGERLKAFGWPMTLSGLSYFVISVFKNLITERIPAIMGIQQPITELTAVVDMVMKPMMDSLLIVLVVGVALLAGGYIVEYYMEKSSREPRIIIQQ